jgi:osmotically-inducible protein OsmY
VEPLERRYFGNEPLPTPGAQRRRRGEPRLAWEIGPGVAGAGDATLSVGPHVGRGPRGYRREDERVRDDVCQWMSDDPRLDAREIEVRVCDGDVTLEGDVADRAARWLAEDIAAAVPGVRDVFNRLHTRARRPA